MRFAPVVLLEAAALLLAVSSSAFAATHTVRLDGTGDFLAIQPAIDACVVGDTVLVGPGTYTGASNRNLDFHGVDLALVSEAGREQTTVDCQGIGRGIDLHSGESNAAVVCGITIRNGRAIEANGGGVSCSSASATFVRLSIEYCEALGAGGMRFLNSWGSIVADVIVTGNSAGTGGGITITDSAVDLDRVVISGNSAGYAGGGKIARSTVNVSETRFIQNATLNDDGGGLYVWLANTHVTLEDCLFQENTARWGAAIYCGTEVDQLDIRRCTFAANEASGSGGGLFVWGGRASVEESLFYANRAAYGGAMYLYDHSDVTVSATTIVGNTATSSAGGLRCVTGSNPTLDRVIVAFNTGGGISSLNNIAGPQLTCCDVWSNPGGDFLDDMVDPTGANGNIAADPLFCGALNPESPYSLQADSPCAAANNGCGALIGAFDVGCFLTGVESTSWGQVKSLY